MMPSTSPNPLPAVPSTEGDDDRGDSSRERLAHNVSHDEDQLIDRLLERLRTMGIASSRDPSTTEPNGEHSHESRKEYPGWERPWKEWHDGWSSHNKWKTDDWKDHHWKTMTQSTIAHASRIWISRSLMAGVKSIPITHMLC